MALDGVGTISSMQVQAARKISMESKKHSNKDVSTEQTPFERLDEANHMAAKAVTDNDENKFDLSQKEPDSETLKKAVENLNKNMANTEAVFGIHEGTNRVTIRIVDRDTKKTIKELPPEKTLDMIARVWEMAGILVDERR